MGVQQIRRNTGKQPQKSSTPIPLPCHLLALNTLTLECLLGLLIPSLSLSNPFTLSLNFSFSSSNSPTFIPSSS